MRALLGDLPLACRRELIDLLEEETPVGTWDWDIVENTFFWSPRQFAHFGLNPLPEGWIDYADWLAAIHLDDKAMVQAAMTNSLATGIPLDLTFRVLWREDASCSRLDVHWIRARGSLIRSSDGSPLRMVGTSRDVTDTEQRRALAKAQRQAEAMDRFGGPSRFDVYFEGSPDCLVQMRVEEDGRFTYQMINEAGLKVIRMSMATARGLTPVDVLGAENGGKMTAMLEEVVKTGLPVSYEPTFAYEAGSVIYDATYMPIHGEDGTVSTILCRARDITEERRMAAALQQAQKMEALGQLAAGVSHDFNNLLTSLRGCFQRLDRLDKSAEVSYVVELGSSALDQGEALTRQLLTFARKEETLVEMIDVNKCVDEALGLARATLPSVELRLRASDGACLAVADHGLLEAAILNLIINARDARPIGCEIEVKIEPAIEIVSPHVDLPAGRYARLVVIDNGPGMTPEVAARAMEPFFTTKPAGAGTGLGLSMVYGSARAFGGTVAIDSTLGLGTTVTIYLRQ